MKITLLLDQDSWINSHIDPIRKSLARFSDEEICIRYNHNQCEAGDVRIILGYTQIIPEDNLAKFKHNLVVHESDLPKGKGMSPLTWQVLEGQSLIPVTLLEANKDCDGGDFYLKTNINLNGSELVDELRSKQLEASLKLITDFLSKPNIAPSPQVGEESFYKKRTQKDSELDLDKSIREQFNLLRVCDPDRYPSFFVLDGQKYNLKIEKVN